MYIVYFVIIYKLTINPQYVPYSNKFYYIFLFLFLSFAAELAEIF